MSFKVKNDLDTFLTDLMRFILTSMSNWWCISDDMSYFITMWQFLSVWHLCMRLLYGVCVVCVFCTCAHQSCSKRGGRLAKRLTPHADQVVGLSSVLLPGQLTHSTVHAAGQRQKLLSCNTQRTQSLVGKICTCLHTCLCPTAHVFKKSNTIVHPSAFKWNKRTANFFHRSLLQIVAERIVNSSIRAGALWAVNVLL